MIKKIKRLSNTGWFFFFQALFFAGIGLQMVVYVLTSRGLGPYQLVIVFMVIFSGYSGFKLLLPRQFQLCSLPANPGLDQPIVYVSPIGLMIIYYYYYGLKLQQDGLLIYTYLLGFTVIASYLRSAVRQLVTIGLNHLKVKPTNFLYRLINRPQPSKPQWFPSSGGLINYLSLQLFLFNLASLVFWFNLITPSKGAYLIFLNFVSLIGYIYLIDRLWGYLQTRKVSFLVIKLFRS